MSREYENQSEYYKENYENLTYEEKEVADRLYEEHGCLLVKSDAEETNIDDLGGYQIIDEETGGVAAGSRFELTLEEAATWFDR